MIQQKVKNCSLFTVEPQVFNLVDNQIFLIFLVFTLTCSLNLDFVHRVAWKCFHFYICC